MNPRVDKQLLERIAEEISSVNEIAQSYVMMKEFVDQQEQLSANAMGPVPDVQMLFYAGEDLDLRRFNLPRTNQIAAVFIPDADNNVPQTRLMAKPRGKEYCRLYTTNPLTDPMV